MFKLRRTDMLALEDSDSDGASRKRNPMAKYQIKIQTEESSDSSESSESEDNGDDYPDALSHMKKINVPVSPNSRALDAAFGPPKVRQGGGGWQVINEGSGGSKSTSPRPEDVKKQAAKVVAQPPPATANPVTAQWQAVQQPLRKPGEPKVGIELYNASIRGDFGEVERLIELNRCHIDTRFTKKKETALHAAANKQHVAVVSCLLNAGASTRIADRRGSYALHHAAANAKNLSVLTMVLKAGADVIDKYDLAKMTPLMMAAFNGQMAAVSLLMSRGADIEKADKKGRMAKDWARRGGHKELAKRIASGYVPRR